MGERKRTSKRPISLASRWPAFSGTNGSECNLGTLEHLGEGGSGRPVSNHGEVPLLRCAWPALVYGLTRF